MDVRIDCFRLYFTHMGADGGSNNLPLLEHEPIHPLMARSVRTWKMPNWFKTVYFSGLSSAVCFYFFMFCLSTVLNKLDILQLIT